MNLADNLTAAAAKFPGNVAVKLDGAELGYAALDGASALVAGLLADRGVGPGDRVAIDVPNVPYFLPIYYGILRLGAVVVPMNVLLKSREVAFHLGDSGAKVIFTWMGFAEEAVVGAEQAGAETIIVAPGEFEKLLGAATPQVEVADRAPDDTAVILYTSGTTGTPKGAELTHANLASNVDTVSEMLGLDDATVCFGALPLFHAFGQTCSLNAVIKAGGTLTLQPRFDPAGAIELIRRDKVNVFMGVPTMYAAMLNDPALTQEATATLALCISGGASLPLEVLRGFEDKTGAIILEGYGLSETSPVASFNAADAERKPGSIGTAVRDVQLKLIDDEGNDTAAGEVGEIAIKGPNVMKGYWNRPDATAATIVDGWFRTGDLAQVDQDGYFFIVDRKKDMIIRGGYNVYPREIEEVLYEHPAVLEAAVLAVPGGELGEEVGAAVVLRPGDDATADEIRSFVKARVAAYKYPRHVWNVDELPKSATGKILKREIGVPGA